MLETDAIGGEQMKKKSKKYSSQKENEFTQGWTKHDEEMAQSVYRTVLTHIGTQMLVDGELILEGRSDAEIIKDIQMESLSALRQEDDPVNFYVDHTTDFLKRAEKELEDGRLEMSILLYATYLEHKINYFVWKLSLRKDLGKEDAKQIIRTTNMEDKCTWLLKIFTGEPLDSLTVKRILKISRMRNDFVHYKWESKDDNEAEKLLGGLSNVDEVLAALDDYEDRRGLFRCPRFIA
jgi:hypothetical protein